MKRIVWALVGFRCDDETKKPSTEELEKLTKKSFREGSKFRLCVKGMETKNGEMYSFDELCEGLEYMIMNDKEYKKGDYCAISNHDGIDLLFLPTDEGEDEAKND